MTDFIPPQGFVETSHPAVAPVDQLVSRAEEITIHRPLADVLDCIDALPLADWITRDAALPGVLGTQVLAGERFEKPGSRHMLFLTDGSIAMEQVLTYERTPTRHHFNYVVGGYTSKAAAPLHYGLGDFVYEDAGAGHTKVRWLYSFALRRDRFPGFMGPLAGPLLKLALLDGPYAKWMRLSLARIKAAAEA